MLVMAHSLHSALTQAHTTQRLAGSKISCRRSPLVLIVTPSVLLSHRSDLSEDLIRGNIMKAKRWGIWGEYPGNIWRLKQFIYVILVNEARSAIGFMLRLGLGPASSGILG